MAGGRPPKYQKEYAEQAYKLCLLGATDERIADFFGVNVLTVHRWKKDHKEFCNALKAGKDEADAVVAQSLYRRATGYERKTVKLAQVDGTFTDAREVIEEVAPDTTACIFWLKNRQREHWRDKTEHDVTVTGDIADQLKAAREALRNGPK